MYECLSVDEVGKLLNESVEKLSNTLKITPSLAKVLLHEHNWNNSEITDKYRDSGSNLVSLNILTSKIQETLTS